MQSDDVRVLDPLQDPDLRQEAGLQLLVQPLHHDLLDRDLRAVDPMPPEPHDGERAGSDLLPDYVVPDNPRSAACRLRHRRNPRNSEKNTLQEKKKPRRRIPDAETTPGNTARRASKPAP